MHFVFKRAETEQDYENFFRLSYQTAKDLDAIQFREIFEKNPGKSEEEIILLFREEMEDSYDFTREDCRVFIAESETGEFAGYVWVALRDNKDIWDFERPLWIYDITVHPDFRRQGLGTELMRIAEAFAMELGKNIGLFVHEQNDRAIQLYQAHGYDVERIPISLRLEGRTVPEESTLEQFPVKTDSPPHALYEQGLQKYRSIVKRMMDVNDEETQKRYDEYLLKYDATDGKHQFFVHTMTDSPLGLVWVRQAPFNERVAMINEVVWNSKETLVQLLKASEQWALANGYSTLYFLLHSGEGISLDWCRKYGFKIPGYFMLKRLK